MGDLLQDNDVFLEDYGNRLQGYWDCLQENGDCLQDSGYLFQAHGYLLQDNEDLRVKTNLKKPKRRPKWLKINIKNLNADQNSLK